MDATFKFQQALPFALLPVSTQLAALHTARTPSQSFPYSCSRCGSELTTSTRVKRSGHNTHPLRSISATCYACGGVSSILVDRGNATNFPARRKLDSRAIPLQHMLQEPVTPLLSPSREGPADRPTSAKSPTERLMQGAQFKSKKKSGLQEMLQRNREQEKKRTKAEDKKPAGLSAFLSTL
ncbi:hypothetical protein GALMADRAFT_133107 [Galerina marginata CBS 339.88]|uniref:C2H2-type domain-containing protein n=1 Tax=Galerina marginata (strain CBS 339.88) TaxID=685588 RepID=A0A067TKC7_GALM3|nr:hypothetical protein GALMADRAFT_133107 [Galerina marginata CBS 339.88]